MVVWPAAARPPAPRRCVAHQPTAGGDKEQRAATVGTIQRPRRAGGAAGAAAVLPLRAESESRFKRFRSVFTSATLW